MLKNVCRVCSKYASNGKSLKLFEKCNRKLLCHIEILTGIRLESYKCLPDLICARCQHDLQDSIKFRKRCINAQRELLDALTEEQRSTVSEYYKLGVTDSKQLMPEEVDILDKIDAIIQQKEELSNEHKMVTKTESLIDESEYNMVISSNSNGTDVDKICRDVSPDDIDNYAYDSNDEVAILDNVLDDELDIEIPKAERSTKTKTEKPRRRTGQTVFICEQCGNHVSGRMAFELHCRRHRGEKQYQCEICQDRFCTTSELKRHMRKHTGERPFACKYCGRRFTDYSTRLKHERTHTNERPYACQNCDKSFTTAYILKNHLLVHSGERAFRCELCDKSFMRNTHLATHYRSSVHKRNLEKQTVLEKETESAELPC